MESNPALAIDNLSVVLNGHTILKDISLKINQGETTAIIGPNGAGKSVLLKTILHLLPKQTGTIRIFGQNNTPYAAVSPLISYIPQKLNFPENFPLTVLGLFSLKSTRFLGTRKNDRARVFNLLKEVGMEKFAHATLSTLSGGQLQRVLIAYSLMDTPKIIFMDEPVSGVDIQGQETVYNLLKRIQQDYGLTLVLVSHELDIVIRFATQVICLNQKLYCAGAPKEVLSNDVLEQMYGTPVAHHVHINHNHYGAS
jgi:zinc transport system ATP-binding protein